MAASLPSKSGTRSANTNPLSVAAAAVTSSPSHTSPLCDHFEGQVFRKNRCKKCLRDKSEHPSEKPVETVISTIPPVAALSSQSPSSSPYKGNIISQSPVKGNTTDQSPQKGNFINQSVGKGTIIEQSPQKGHLINQSVGKGTIIEQSPQKGNFINQSPGKGSVTDQTPVKGNIIDQSASKGNITGQSPVKGNITDQALQKGQSSGKETTIDQSPPKGTITDQSSQKGHIANQSSGKGDITNQSPQKGNITHQSPSSSPYKANVKENTTQSTSPSPYQPKPPSSNGILKTSQNGTVTPHKPPTMSSSRLRPIQLDTGGDSSPSGSHEQLNTTTQTIILSKHSPQIRRASSGESSRVLHGVRRFGSAEKVNEEEDEEGNLEMRTPLSGSLVSMVTAVESASDLMSMHTAESAGSQNSLNSVGTYTSSRENFQDTVEEMQATIRSLTEQLDDKIIALQDLESQNSDLRDQLASPLQSGTNATGGTLTRKRDEQKRLRELEREKTELLTSSQTLQDDLDRIREAMDEVNDPDEATASLVERVRDAAHKLQSAEMMCEDLMDDNEELKKELRSLESEMDELHDHFRQDQAVEFQTIQKEMEQTMKNCRILQFKLRKAERKCDELEADKAIYEVKLRQLTNVTPVAGAGGDQAYVQEMATELRQVMEVNKRLQEEIERVDEERSKVKMDYDALMKSAVQKDTYRSQTGPEPEVVPPNSSVGPVHVQISNAGAPHSIGSASGAGQEYDVNQLLRDLYDSVERETDLRDQLAFAEDQARRLRSQLTDAEHENDSMQHQLKKMSAARPPSGDYSKTATPEQLDIMQINEDMKVQLDVAEHEISALKRKLQEADHRNEELGAEAKRLKVSCDELKSAKDTMSSILDETKHTGTISGTPAAEQKIRLLEAEATELRKKLVDKERQLERLSSQIDQVKRRGTLDRSRSLDDAQVIDLRRQLTTAEQEISVLRQKAHALESDNDRLSAENKRLQFRTGGRRSTEEPGKSEGMVKISEEVAEKYLADIAALSAAGKSAKELLEEMGELRQRVDESAAVMATAKDSYERILAKAPIKKDIATRQELKSRIDELEADMKFALTVAEQEGTAAKRLQTEVEELRAKMRRAAVQDAPISDEVKAYRIKLYDTEHEVEALKLEIKDLQGSLVDERRRARSSESDIIAKERMDTQLRNLKQELAKQRYMVEELTSKDNTLSKQLNEWQKKYHSLKDAYKSDTDAWQKELTDLEQELGKEKSLRVGDTGSVKSLEKDIQQLKNKNASYEDQIRNLIEVGKLREKELREKNAKLDTDMAKEKKAAEELRVQLENRQVETGMQEAKLQAEKERLEQKVSSLTKELEETTTQSKKEADKLRTELEKLKKATLETDKALQEAKSEADKLRQERTGDGAKAGYARLSAYERARAADQIKEEVEKLHKQNLELQKQLLDAKRASEEANEQLARSERKWGCERDETQRKLRQDEKIHKAEMSAVSMRFENKHKLLEDEMKTSNVTVKQLKKERDTLQERLDQLTSEMQRLREEHADSSSKLETANSQLFSIKTNRENAQHQLDEAQGRLNKLEAERNDAKSKAAKEKSSYELKIAELQDKLSQYEGQHAKLSAYALKTRQMAQTGKKSNGDAVDVTDMKERAEAAEKAVRRAEKDVTDMKAHVLAVKLDKERENELLRAKIRELQEKHHPIKDAHASLKLAYDSLHTELEVIQIERDDFAERLAENESYQIKERGKIDQILSEIQKLKDVAPSLLSSDEDLFVSSPSVPQRPSRGRTRDGALDDKISGLSVPATTADHKKYKGTKSADLQKAIDNITKVSEDIKAERKTRRPILPHKRSQSASIAESSAGSSPLIRRYPSLDDDETGDAMSLPTPTPLKSIAKLTHRNPRFPSIPPSFIVSPPTASQLAALPRDKHRARYDAAGSPITEESFTNPGGSWDSIDSDMSSESWNLPAARAGAHDDRLSYISLPNLPQKVDTATSMEDKPKRSLLDVAKAKRKKLMAKLRPLSLHSSTESIEESVRVSHSDSSGFFEPPAKPKSPVPAAPEPTAPAPRYGHGSAPATVQSSPAFGRPAKEAIPAPTVPEKTKVKEAAKERSVGAPSRTAVAATSTASTSTATETSTVPTAPIKEVKFTEGKGGSGKPYLNVWRKPISDIAKKFENKGK